MQPIFRVPQEVLPARSEPFPDPTQTGDETEMRAAARTYRRKVCTACGTTRSHMLGLDVALRCETDGDGHAWLVPDRRSLEPMRATFGLVMEGDACDWPWSGSWYADRGAPE